MKSVLRLFGKKPALQDPEPTVLESLERLLAEQHALRRALSDVEDDVRHLEKRMRKQIGRDTGGLRGQPLETDLDDINERIRQGLPVGDL